MKIYFKLISFLIFCGLAGCTVEQDAIFDQSSAVRLNEAIKSSKEYFSTPENGWLMEYFPNRESAGVVFLVRFDKNGSCDIATKNTYVSNYTMESSLYEMIADNGPVLTFNSYNTLLHLFSYPSLPGESIADGRGLEGDYEFIVLRKEADYALLKGKKWGAYIRMIPLNTSMDWPSLLNQVSEMRSRLFSNETGLPLLFVQNTDVIKAYSGNTGIFNMVKEGKDFEEGEPLPFIVLPDRIRFYSDGMDTKGTEFRPNEDNTRIDPIDSDVAEYFTGPKLNDFFVEKATYVWKADTAAFNAATKVVFDKLREELALSPGFKGQMRFAGVDFGSAPFYGQIKPALIIRFKQNNSQPAIPILMEVTASGENQITINFPEPLDYSSNGNGANFINKGVDEFLQIPSQLKGTYQISSKNSFLIKDVKLGGGNQNIELVR
ncbi:MAG: DUF4302 domain-containing protein [Bacteroidales bacterium]